MKIAIESGIEMPRGRSRYPWSDMKVGDSFEVAGSDVARCRISNAALFYAKNNPGVKFTTRKTDTGYRCWRIS